MKRIGKIIAASVIVITLTLLLGIASSRTVRAAVSALVTVANTFANPVPIQRADNPARQAVNLNTGDLLFYENQDATGGLFKDATGNLYSVPVDRRLVIESASGFIFVPMGQHPVAFIYFNSGGTFQNPIYGNTLSPPLTFVATIAGSDLYQFATPYVVYVDPATQITVGTQRNSNSGAGYSYFTLSGHLENIQ